jgi:glycosyltransferase involved in cell wall biosynthesis
MRLLIAVTSHLSYCLVDGQIKYLTSKGHEVYFCSSYCSNVKKKVEEEGGKYVAFNLDREINILQDVLSVFRAIKILKLINPDIINISTPKASLVFSLASLFCKKIKVIHTMRGLRSDTLKGLKYSLVKFMETLVCNIANVVIVISPSLRAHAIDKKILIPRKSIVFGKGSSNGININKFTITPNITKQAEALKNKLAIPNNSLVFGYIGRITKDKGVIELLESFKLINDKYPNTFLILKGPIESDDYIGDEFTITIRNHPSIRHIDGFTNDIATIISVFSVLVLYSCREGFGNVAIEASSMFKPVLVSNIPGAKDTIEDKVTGLLVEPKNTSDLFLKMEHYILYPNELEEHGLNGRKRVEDYFLNTFIWKQQLDLYVNMLN